MTGTLLGIFLVAAAYFAYVTRRSYSQLGRVQRCSLLGLRLTVFALLLLGLSGVTIKRQAEDN